MRLRLSRLLVLPLIRPFNYLLTADSSRRFGNSRSIFTHGHTCHRLIWPLRAPKGRYHWRGFCCTITLLRGTEYTRSWVMLNLFHPMLPCLVRLLGVSRVPSTTLRVLISRYTIAPPCSTPWPKYLGRPCLRAYRPVACSASIDYSS